MPTELLTIAGPAGNDLSAALELPDGDVRGAALYAHCFTCTKQSRAAVVTIGAPADVAHVQHQISGDIAAVERDGEGEVSIGGRPFTITRTFLENLRGIDLAAEVGDLGRPLLILHSPTDQFVGIENAARLFEAAKHPKSFVSLAGADHLLLEARDAEFAATVIAAWASRYLPNES